MQISLAQVDSGDDTSRNLDLIRGAVARAAGDGSTLVFLPEYSMYEKKVVDGTFSGVAEPVDGSFATAISNLAVEHRIAIVVGMVESNEASTKPYNTLIAIGDDGRLLARYRKIHLFDSYGFKESEWIAPAPEPEPVTFEVGGARIGLMTCYDLRFPELGRELADAGAQLVGVCSSWVPGDHKADQWRVLARARAIENSYFVAAVSQAAPISIGRSLLCSPSGVVLGELGDAPGTLTASFDPDEVAAARERDPVLLNRRMGAGGTGGAQTGDARMGGQTVETPIAAQHSR